MVDYKNNFVRKKNSCVRILPQHNCKLQNLYCYHHAHKLIFHVLQKSKKSKVRQLFENWTFTNVHFSKSQITFKKKYYFDRIQEIQNKKHPYLSVFMKQFMLGSPNSSGCEAPFEISC